MRTTAALVTLVVLSSCGSEDPASDTTDLPMSDFPDSWSDTIDNPWLPLTPGTTWTYRVTSEDGVERNVVTVTEDTKVVDGVTATVVHDQVKTADGELLEDTFDWYAQDSEGNVWYLGEDTTAYDGSETSTEGSWEAGVDGAEAGIIMLANPKVGDSYQQEYYEGEAEDRGRVLSLDESVRVPYGKWTGVLQTEDTTPLEPDLVEHKYYAKGIGVVEERDVEGGDEHVVLVRLTRS